MEYVTFTLSYSKKHKKNAPEYQVHLLLPCENYDYDNVYSNYTKRR